jgi:hypothetical protein
MIAIKISGEGSPQDVVRRLQQVVQTIQDEIDGDGIENGWGGTDWENETLSVEIEVL